MKITIIGAGAIGSAIAQDLLKRSAVTQVQICDARPGVLKVLQEQVNSSQLRTFQIDARDLNMLESILKGSACVISSASPDLNFALAELCLNLGINFCDLGGSDQTVQQQLALDERARKKSVWIVPNCGLAPGLINILCMHGVEQFASVESAHLRVGDVPLEPIEPFKFHLTFSPEKLIEDYTEPSLVLENGVVNTCRSLTGIETIRFPKPFGELEAFYSSGGLSTLPYDLEGKVQTLDFKTIRYPGHARQISFLFGLGLADKQSIDVRTHLTYRDVLVRRMRQRLTSERPDAVLLRVVITGVSDEKRRTLVYEMIDQFSEEEGLTAMKRCTAFPVAAIATLIASRKVPGGGAAPPERIVPKDQFFEAMRQRKLNIVKKWHDERVTLPEAALKP